MSSCIFCFNFASLPVFNVLFDIIKYFLVWNAWCENFLVFRVDLGKAEEPEIKLPTSFGS